MTGPNYAAQAAMLCEETPFKLFLVDATGLPTSTKDEAGEALRTLADVSRGGSSTRLTGRKSG